MSANKFNLFSNVTGIDETEIALKEYYKNWRYINKQAKSPFISIDNNFFKNQHLKTLEGGPLKLYLYFAFAAKNEHGHSWHSIAKIAEYFNAQTRTIDNWIKVLVERDLVYREQKGKKSHTTYLLPFSDTIIRHSAFKKNDEDNQSLLDEFITKISNLSHVYGEVTKVFHIFQWSKSKSGNTDRYKSLQLLLVITKRQTGILIGHICRLTNSNHLSVDKLDIDDPSVFTSPFKYNALNIKGLVLPSTPMLTRRSSAVALLDLTRKLEENEEWKFKELPEVVYGDKNTVLPAPEESEELEKDE